MKVNLLLFLLVAIAALGVLVPGRTAQSAPCTTPSRQPGMCVRVERCKNIYNIITSPTPMPQYDNYIKRAACTLPGVPRSICCQPTEVAPEPTTTTTTLAPLTGNVNVLPTDCGQSVSDRIAGGNVTKVFDYPWMALLRYETNGAFIDGCGGSIIHKRYVLTAAHCLKTRSTLRIDHVILGEHTRSTDIDCNIYRGSNGEEIERDCADPAEMYKPWNTQKYPTFAEFVNYMLDEVRHPHFEIDMHWIPVTYFCTPCFFHYDVIAKFETLDEDQNYLISVGQLGNMIKPQWKNAGKGAHTNDVVLKLFGELEDEQVRGLYEYYKYDFELFGYGVEDYLKGRGGH